MGGLTSLHAGVGKEQGKVVWLPNGNFGWQFCSKCI